MNNYLGRSSGRFTMSEQAGSVYPQFLQYGSVASSGTAGLSLSMYNVTEGNHLIISNGWYSSATVPTITDSFGTTYERIIYKTGASATSLVMWLGKLRSSGRCNVTCSVAGSSYTNTIIAEVSNLQGIIQNTNFASSTNSSPTCSIIGPGLAIAAIEGYHNETTYNTLYPSIILRSVNGGDAQALACIENIHGENRIFSFGGGAIDNWLITAACIT